jgi:hypothetical protein
VHKYSITLKENAPTSSANFRPGRKQSRCRVDAKVWVTAKRFSSSVTYAKHLLDIGRRVPERATSTSKGVLQITLRQPLDLGGENVANGIWRALGKKTQECRCRSGKPMSSMRSASSSTTYST